jgi:hypothetical protein
MKLTIIILAIAGVAAAGAFALSRSGIRGVSVSRSGDAATAKTESPFACDREALSPELRKRHFEELGPQLRSLRKAVRELPDGYEFEFAADQNTYAMVTEWSLQETKCCPFFDIDIQLGREGGPLVLRLTGREGTKDFLREEAPAWING